ncbi:MAG: hypothetical protein JNJ63_00095 [Hyphomonadaceae bacterium]|nr:hypothetical protein [Hyphomonadaceae bacterium]
MKPHSLLAAVLVLSGCQTGHDLSAARLGQGADLRYVRQHGRLGGGTRRD